MQRNHNGTLTPEQRIEKNVLAIITHKSYRSLGGVVMMGRTEVTDCPTACTDGLNTQYGREFIGTLTDPELRFVILHENGHKAFRHLTTWRWMWEEDPQTANAACDYVINLMLVRSDPTSQFLKMPQVGLCDERFDGMDASEVYRILRSEGNGHAGGGFDEHLWREAKIRGKEEEQKLEEDVKTALRQGGMMNGTLGGAMDRAVKDMLAPKVNWRQELWEFVSSLCKGHDMSTWRRPNRRSIDSGIYTPSTYTESVGRLVLAVDTSGSISGDFIGRFLSEVVGICNTVNPELLDLIYWDGHVAGHEKYAQGQYGSLIASTKPKGGGGTAPSCVSTYLREQGIKPECVVVLTDGHVGNDWGSGWSAPVLWCIVNNKRATPTTGRAIHVEV